MALKGTLKDFGTADIFQLISFQRKSGILRVSREGEQIAISFLHGDIVWADTSKRELEEKLGQVLLKNGKITAQQLDVSLELQKKTLQRLGHILVSAGHIKQDDLKRALSRQAKLIAHRIFRWNDGEFDFDQEAELEYDKENFIPLSAESILMECAQMTDEWQIIEKRIKLKDIFSKVSQEDKVAVGEVESIIDEDIDFGFGKEGRGEESGKIRLSPDAALIYNLLDGETTAGEIIQKSNLGDFETLRLILELLNRNLIRKTRPGDVREEYRPFVRVETGRIWKLVFSFALIGLVSLSLFLFPKIYPGKYLLHSFDRYRNDLLRYVSKTKIEKIDTALTVHYYTTARFPVRLEELFTEDLVTESDLFDPWGYSYDYALFDDAYRLQGLNGDGKEDSLLKIINKFSNMQKVIIQSSTAEGKKTTFSFATDLP